MNKSIITNQQGKIAAITAKINFHSVINGLFLSISILIGLNSCSKEDAKLAFNDIPVVEAYLLKNNPVSIKITRKTPYDDNVAFSGDSLNLLQVKISYNDQIRVIPSLGNGVYKDTTFLPQEGITYKLEFEFNNQRVTSSTDIPSKPMNYKQSVKELEVQSFDFSNGPPSGGFQMADPVKLTWDNTDQGYYMVVIENIEKSPTAITDFGDNDPPGRSFRNEPTQSNQYEIPSMNFQYYGKHRLILYHLNADYSELYKDNGNSSQNLTNPITNIENGLGIFTGINADTLMLNIIKQ